MAARRVNHPNASQSRRPPATTPEARENQMIIAASLLAEQQLMDGTASAAVIVHYLKAGSQRELLEREKLAGENQVLRAKAEALASGKRSEELMQEALMSFRKYSGQDDPGAESDDEY